MRLFTMPMIMSMLLVLPCTISANVPEHTARFIHTSYESNQLYITNSADANFSSTSTMYFTDETGSLLSFDVKGDGHTMSAVIRKNGIPVWNELFPETSHKYNITRQMNSSTVYFLMHLGSRTYTASYNTDDNLLVTRIQ